MTSSPNVVRSISADELASSLVRTDRPTPPPDPAPSVIPLAEQKAKTGLLKRLRRALRLNAQTVRSSRPDKNSRHPLYSPSPSPHSSPPPPTPPPPPPLQSHSSSRLSQPHPQHDSADLSKSIPRDSLPDATRSSPALPTTRKHHHQQHQQHHQHQQHQQQQPSSTSSPNQKPTPRSFTWRGGLSSRHAERAGPELGDTKHDSSRRFISLRSNDTKHKPGAATFTSVANSDGPAANAANPAPPPTGRGNRSLPKRVFSSPPSLTSRTFNFGNRKRASMNAKNAPPRAGTFSNDVTEGDSDSVKRLNKAMNARTGVETRGPPAPAPGNNMASFATVVEGATTGRLAFTVLLDAMYRLEERLTPNVKEMLIKYLGKQENMEALIDHLTVVIPDEAEDDDQGPQVEKEKYRYSYVSSMLLSNGPIQLRRSLFFNHKHLDRLIKVLGHGTPTDPVIVRSVCKVLLSVLRDSPEDTVRAMGRRKDFIDALLSHIAVTGCPEVCLSMLSTVRSQAELKFGPSNKPVVGMMADSKLVKTLCDKLADAAENGPLDGTSSSTIENCSRVIVGIALRALVIPRYEINDDDSDAAYMRKFNKDLSSLDVFSQPTPILRLLDSGLTALNAHDTRGYALSTALTAVRYLLVTALNGQESSLSTIRMQLLTVNTQTYEAGIRARIPKMAKVLETAREGASVDTMWERVDNPLGVVRLKILELVVVLLQHCGEVTAKAIAKAEVPRILLDLFVRLKLNSLLQHFVAAIVELSFSGKFECLRRAFLVDVRLIDVCMELWEKSQQNVEDARVSPVNYTGELLRMVCAVHDFFRHDSQEARDLKRELGMNKLEEFRVFYEGPVSEKLKENGPLLCGPGELPLRPVENFGIDGYSSMGGSQGSLFLRSRGPGTAVNT